MASPAGGGGQRRTQRRRPLRGRVAGGVVPAGPPGRGRGGRRAAGPARPGPTPRWWGAVGALQTVLALTIVLGALWLLALFALDYLRLPQLPLPHLGRVPLPTVLLVGGAVAGLLLALLARIANGAGARRRAARARRNLTERVAAVADDAVVAPLEAELSARTELCAALAVADADPPR